MITVDYPPGDSFPVTCVFYFMSPFQFLETPLILLFVSSALYTWFLISWYFSSFVWPLNKHLQRRRGKERASEREPGKESGVCSPLTVAAWLTGATTDSAKSFHSFSATPWGWKRPNSQPTWGVGRCVKETHCPFVKGEWQGKKKNKKTWAEHGEGG